MDVAAGGASVPTRASSQAHHSSVAERAAKGKQMRVTVPREIHGEGSPAPDRPDPLGVLEEQDRSRVPELVLIRRERLAASPFSFTDHRALVDGIANGSLAPKVDVRSRLLPARGATGHTARRGLSSPIE